MTRECKTIKEMFKMLTSFLLLDNIHIQSDPVYGLAVYRKALEKANNFKIS